MLKSLINMLTKKLKINRKIVAGITVLLFYATVGAVFTLIIVKVFIALKDVLYNFLMYIKIVLNQLYLIFLIMLMIG